MIKQLFCICLFLFLASFSKNEPTKMDSNEIKTVLLSIKEKKDYTKYFLEAKTYCEKNNLNKKVFILIDLGLHSGLKRFFVFDFKTNKIFKSYMVSHGCCHSPWGETMTKSNATFSNVLDSHCSSIGKYIVLNRGSSQWGIKVNYLLKGKDKSNSNAIKRSIVLHSWEAIPNDEVYPQGTPEGWGCPALSNDSMKAVDELLKKQKKFCFG